MKKKIQSGGKNLLRHKSSELKGLLVIAGGSATDPEHTKTLAYYTQCSANDADYHPNDMDPQPPVEPF